MGLKKLFSKFWKRIVEVNRGSYNSPIIQKMEREAKARKEYDHPARKKAKEKRGSKKS